MSRTGPPSSHLVDPADSRSIAQFAADVQYYLGQSPRQLPSRYLYDALGSALFEAICRLPWYHVTRAEERLLAVYGDEVFRRVAPVSTIVELGSGSGEKLRILLEDRRTGRGPTAVHLVDVSRSALDASARAIAASDVRVIAHQALYEDGLKSIGDRIDGDGRALVLFLGSNIGNYDPPGADAFLRGVRSQLRAGDALLLGADLVKSPRDLQLAYDDPLGVTAAFNRNLLVRINRELGGNFDVDAFAHLAEWNATESRIEMHLVARRTQHVNVQAAQMAFAMQQDERIWTESSYKYQPDGVIALLESTGFRSMEQWIDRDDQFALTLVEAA